MLNQAMATVGYIVVVSLISVAIIGGIQVLIAYLDPTRPRA